MKFLLILAIILILAVVFGLVDLSPLLTEAQHVDAVPAEGIEWFLQWFPK